MSVDLATAQATARLARCCDRCGARARARVTVHTDAELGDVEMLFCQHHFDEHAAKLGELLLAGTVSIESLQPE